MVDGGRAGLARIRQAVGFVGFMHVRAEAASAAVVRASLTADLTGHGMPAETINDAALVATELITNAIRHGQPLSSGRLAVQWTTDGVGVLIRITDGGGASQPTLLNSAPEDIGGRGLAIVDSLSASWGVDIDADQVTVWAYVSSPSPTLPSRGAPGDEARVRRRRPS
jgi:anti-sigma regulatory factor (Ser/Thr protein kinase)